MKNLVSNLHKFGHRILITFIVLLILFVILFPKINEPVDGFNKWIGGVHHLIGAPLFSPVQNLINMLPAVPFILFMILIIFILFILFINDTFGYKITIPFIIFIIYTIYKVNTEEKSPEDTVD